MTSFSGFPDGKLAHTSLPNLVFSELLPQVDDLSELKTTLHILWLLYHKTGTPRYVTLQELFADRTLSRSVGGLASSPRDAVQTGLQKAVARGTLLHLRSEDGQADFYLVNSPQGRRTVEQAQLGEIRLSDSPVLADVPTPATRPNIFVQYEQNIGLLQPIIAEELQEAEQTYPQAWIDDAFRIAIENNVRNWKYIRRILERWAAEGRGDNKGKTRDKTWYTEEESRKYIQR